MQHYFFGGTAFGAAAALLVALSINGLLRAAFDDRRSLLAALLGVTTCLMAGWLLDRRIGQDAPALRQALLGAAGLFLVAALSGCAANLLLHAGLETGGAKEASISWFLRPLAWLCSAGLPLSVVVALLYHALRRWMVAFL